MRLVGLTPDDPCLRMAGDGVQCGLLWQHPGPCLPFVPGDYLPPPILHPLDLGLAFADRWHQWCPLCWQQVTYWCSSAQTAFRGDSLDFGRPSMEHEFTFRPCGCVGRVVETDVAKGFAL